MHLVFLFTLLYSITALDPCLENKNCSSCLDSPGCGWLHGIQSTEAKGKCTNYCVTKNVNGTAPQEPTFALALTQAKSKSCVCKLTSQCGLWFPKKCPECSSYIKCEDCLAQKGCNMHTSFPFNCTEYDFTDEIHQEKERKEGDGEESGKEDREKEKAGRKRQEERPLWIGNSCGALCSLEYSFTNCTTCVDRKDLMQTGVVCGWCGEPDFSKDHDNYEECLPNIGGLPYGEKDRCAHGNASKWFTHATTCGSKPNQFPYLSIAFSGSVILVFLVLVIIYLFTNRRQERFMKLEKQGLKTKARQSRAGQENSFYNTTNINERAHKAPNNFLKK
eukprot:TRINITY_DN7587_c0_g1_i1.p1 TRINITY_DN7587_c0_g1~~TRINITY_DN7587_c0_g1_i1.p1  ORF type:complete len:333 (-),score=61.28 TRINITY_DN7587_c0_g1_i1:34-1032(-)